MNKQNDRHPVAIAQLPGCFGRPELGCVCQCVIWAACVRQPVKLPAEDLFRKIDDARKKVAL